jgi:hypothetical protein
MDDNTSGGAGGVVVIRFHGGRGLKKFCSFLFDRRWLLFCVFFPLEIRASFVLKNTQTQACIGSSAVVAIVIPWTALFAPKFYEDIVPSSHDFVARNRPCFDSIPIHFKLCSVIVLGGSVFYNDDFVVNVMGFTFTGTVQSTVAWVNRGIQRTRSTPLHFKLVFE